MNEQAVKEWPEIELARDVIDDPPRPFFPEALGPDEGWRLMDEYKVETYVPQQRVNALVEALEEVQGEIYLWQIGEGPWQGEPTDLIAHLHKVARTALANYKEGEA